MADGPHWRLRDGFGREGAHADADAWPRFFTLPTSHLAGAAGVAQGRAVAATAPPAAGAHAVAAAVGALARAPQIVETLPGKDR